jgi:hypothetical protein
MLSSGILHHVDLAGTDVLEECITSIIRMARIGKHGSVFAAISVVVSG